MYSLLEVWMELGFRVLKFPAFEQVLSLTPDGLPKPVQLELGGIDVDPSNIAPFHIQMMIVTLMPLENVPDQYFFSGISVRTLDKKKHTWAGHSHIRWKTAIGVFDRHRALGAIELCESPDSQRLDTYRAVATNDLGTKRLMKAIGLIP